MCILLFEGRKADREGERVREGGRETRANKNLNMRLAIIYLCLCSPSLAFLLCHPHVVSHACDGKPRKVCQEHIEKKRKIDRRQKGPIDYSTYMHLASHVYGTADSLLVCDRKRREV